ncbi:EamA family transporter [Geodermatophilus chilensis]|jgi:inner membrane transporter RhtA|uniref:EamA family transporter n=1 Tax=Geodermatophilus chilensis TaxID=2035835 RepID=UPI0018E4070D|nr:EamA family transporter [Geodermatophilus chilensis]
MSTASPAGKSFPGLAGGAPLGVGLALGSQIVLQISAAAATGLFPRVGAIGAVGIRLGLAAVMLLAFFRPSLRTMRRSNWSVVLQYGAALAGMNVLFYEAILRLPLGAAVTLTLLGPLTLSVVASRVWSSVLWGLLALTGVALLGRDGFTKLDLLGVGCAVGAGALWACYIVSAQRSAATLPRLDGLALAMAVAAVGLAPFAVASAGTRLFSPPVIALAAAVAALSSIPYALEALSLRRLSSSTFAVLMSSAPAIAALVGAVLLGQRIDASGALAIGCVVVASAGAVATPSDRDRHRPRPQPRRRPSLPKPSSDAPEDGRVVL